MTVPPAVASFDSHGLEDLVVPYRVVSRISSYTGTQYVTVWYVLDDSVGKVNPWHREAVFMSSGVLGATSTSVAVNG